jgi:hypothetical protein
VRGGAASAGRTRAVRADLSRAADARILVAPPVLLVPAAVPDTGRAVQTLIVLLAVVGGLALIGRLLRSIARTALAGMEAAAASGLAETSARHGDLTGMAERRAAERTARGRVWLHAAWTALWLLALLAPWFGGFAREAFAAASVLWFFPHAAIRPAAPRAAE